MRIGNRKTLVPPSRSQRCFCSRDEKSLAFFLAISTYPSGQKLPNLSTLPAFFRQKENHSRAYYLNLCSLNEQKERPNCTQGCYSSLDPSESPTGMERGRSLLWGNYTLVTNLLPVSTYLQGSTAQTKLS